MTRAVVVFADSDGHPLRFLLRRGFRHVFVFVECFEGWWVRVDPQAHGIDIQIAGGPTLDIEGLYRDAGCTVVRTRIYRGPRRWPLVLGNCVGAVKSVLNIDAPLVWTPYQLYRLLTGDTSDRTIAD